MGYKTILFSTPCKLFVKNKQLVYHSEDTENKTTIPLEDISVIILENSQILITNYLLSACADNNIAIFTCNEKHMPNAVMTPFYQHSRAAKIAQMQISAGESLKKRIWQKIIKQKISNQSYLLKTIYDDDTLDGFIQKVQSGDKTNIEGQAAKLYWSRLFKNFKRHEDTVVNSALDYGYAIIRGMLSKHISASGLIPCLGVNHHNELNAFNLTEDLIEPFRPFVDQQVIRMAPYLDENLTKEDKGNLINILNRQCIYKNEHITIQSACESVCKSFVNAIEKNNYNLIELPKFDGAK